MFKAIKQHRHQWEDVGAVALALGYLGGFVAAVEFALSRLVFLSSF
ncbi:hypothetical protein [Dankookia sp. P2]